MIITFIARGALASTLLQNVAEQREGDSIDLNYYDRKFQMIQATFEVMRQEIFQILVVIEIMDNRLQEKKLHDIIIK